MTVSFSTTGAALATAALAGLATLVSCHVLLTKRETRSAIGWIGLIWLSPLAGTAIYILLGINRIRRQARTDRRAAPRAERAIEPKASEEAIREAVLDGAYHLGALVSSMGQITGRTLSAGNQVDPLRAGPAAYSAMLEAIDSAQRSIGLASYIFNHDEVGSRFVEALERARKRGVEVRVLIDAIGVRYRFPTVLKPLRRAEIPVATFLPSLVPGYFHYFNIRNHRKILLIDGIRAFTGGMNIDGAYARAVAPRHDLHFQVQGPVVATIREVFADDWAFTTGEVLHGEDWSPPLAPKGHSLARGLIDGPDDSIDNLSRAFFTALSCARTSVAIVSPYFLPEPPLIAALCDAAMRGVEVDIVVPGENNLKLVQWASNSQMDEMVERGCRIWESPPPFDHTKIMIVDQTWVFLGSGNWDPRSLRLNFEFNIECYDRFLARTLLEEFRKRLEVSRLVTLERIRSRSLAVKLRDSAASLLSPYL